MSAPSRDPRDSEDIAALVEELETTLSQLRAELAEREGRAPDTRDRRPRDRWDDRRRTDPPRPPAVGELFRFTSDYTIPTVVAILEATIEALELLQGVVDLAAPGETPERRRHRDRRDRRGLGRTMLSDALADGVSSATDRASTDAADALARLREALTEADLPTDEESRDLVADARELSAELERRVRDSRATVDRERDRERRDARGSSAGHSDGPVTIAVGDPDDEEAGTDDGEERSDAQADDEGPAPPSVDVDAELESIKRQMGKGDEDTDVDAGSASPESDNDGDDESEDE
ncbi:DUF7547 family protein [Halobaculum marinum]|uniref:Uncharacterized protein n=1 Tax=Halobaculum marinum TaxID=3031996 RepID=A0ABD5X2M1_9EURY|nr:hypothetical protein [Halobaculum sp. DT55]